MPWDEDCYDHNPDLSQYYQGDVLRDVPFPLWPTLWDQSKMRSWAILRPLAGVKRSHNPIDRLPNYVEAKAANAVSDAFDLLDKQEFVMIACQLRTVIVLTRGCQLDHTGRKHLVVAPVTAIEQLPEPERKPEMLNALRKYEIPHKFYLPANGDLRESFADLLKMTYLHRTFLDDARVDAALLARLSSVAQSKLQHFTALHFGSSFGFSHENEVPQDGCYACSSCFYRGYEVRKVDLRKGAIFGSCPTCGENAEYVKLPARV